MRYRLIYSSIMADLIVLGAFGFNPLFQPPRHVSGGQFLPRLPARHLRYVIPQDRTTAASYSIGSVQDDKISNGHLQTRP
jgi:hypothetical protein